MEERIDLYNDLGQATGKTQLRSEELREDAWYLVVTVWVRDRGGKLLLTQRKETKTFYPLCWEATGGFAQAGEGPWQAACLELTEETGLTPPERQWRFLGMLHSLDIVHDHKYQALAANYLVTLEENEPEITCQPEEVRAARWVTGAEYLALPESEQEPFTPYSFRHFRREILGE